MILKIFLPKNLAKKLATKFGVYSLKLLLGFVKNFIRTWVFETNAKFFTENWQKSQKLVIIANIDPGLGNFSPVE
jgi:hypothetical protein